MNFGETVRANRKAQGLRQSRLALIVGVSQAKISRIEHGGSLTWELARHLAAVLDIDLNAFKSTLPTEPADEAASLSLDAMLHMAAAMNIDLNAFKPQIPGSRDLETTAA